MNHLEDIDRRKLGAIFRTLVHTYLAKIDKPRNDSELEAYNRKVAKLISVAESKTLAHIDTLILRGKQETLEGLQKHWHLVGSDGAYEALLNKIAELESQIEGK